MIMVGQPRADEMLGPQAVTETSGGLGDGCGTGDEVQMKSIKFNTAPATWWSFGQRHCGAQRSRNHSGWSLKTSTLHNVNRYCHP